MVADRPYANDRVCLLDLAKQLMQLCPKTKIKTFLYNSFESTKIKLKIIIL